MRSPGLGLIWLAAQKGFVVVLGVVAGGVVSRHLGPSGAGVLASAQALVGMFGIFAMGVDATVFMDEMRQGQRGENAVMGGTSAILALMGFISWLMLALYLVIFESDSRIFAVTTFIAGTRLLVTFPAPVALWFQSRLMMREIVIPNTIGSLVLRTWQIVSCLFGWGTIKIALGEVISLLFILAASLSAYLKQGGNPLNWKFDLHAGGRVLARSIPAMTAAVLTTLMSRMDVLMVRAIRSEDVAGIYSAASSLTESMLFVGGMITSVFVPLLLEKKVGDTNGYQMLRLDHLKFITFAGWSMALGLSLCSGFVIRLIFGEAFKAASAVLMIHAFILVHCLVASALQSHLTIEKKMRYLTFNLLLALIGNAALNLLFIPVLGAPGAALASLLAASLVYLIVPLFSIHTRHLGIDVLRALFCPIPRLSALKCA